MLLIAGDIGGTKTDVGLYSTDSGPHQPLVRKQFHSASYPSLQAIILEFLAQSEIAVPIPRGSFSVAGPVIEGSVKITNLPWTMDERSLATDLKFEGVQLINDLEAVARAVPILRPNDIVTLNEGHPVDRGAIAIIAPGTGLGESFLIRADSGYVAHGSEGGHSDFAPTDARQIRLLQYLLRRFDHVGVERVCSGVGLPNIYDYLGDEEKLAESPEVTRAIAGAPDRTKAIIEAALDPRGPSERCRVAVETLGLILASEAGSLVLKVLATGGVYIAGGVALHLVDILREPSFLRAFTRKGRFKDVMERIPIHLITAQAALTGAAAAGLEHLTP